MSPLTSQVLKGNGLGLSDLSDITLLILNILNIFIFLFVKNILNIYIRKMETNHYTSRRQQIDALNAQKFKIAEDLRKLVFAKPSKRTYTKGILKLPKEVIKKILFEHFKEKLLFYFKEWMLPFIQLNEDNIKYLCENTNVIAIEILKSICENGGEQIIELLDWKELSKNPIAIEILQKPEYRKHIEWEELAGNSAALDLLLDEKETHPENFHWGNFSANSKGFHLIADKSLDEAELIDDALDVIHQAKKLDWGKVSSNRSTKVIQYLKDLHPDKINYGRLSGNPNPLAIEMLRERIIQINSMSKRERKALRYEEKIDWYLLSSNYAAIELLKENMNEIRYDGLSANENAIMLIRNRIKEEKYLRIKAKLLEENRKRRKAKLIKEGKTSKQANALVPPRKSFLYENNILNWALINANRKAINILKENQDKIRLDYLLKNPSIFEPDRGNKQPFNSKLSPVKWDISS
jgi:hypothetical protein